MSQNSTARNGVFILLCRVAFVMWTLLIGVATFLPQSSDAANYFTLGGRDSIAHFSAYGVLTVLTGLALQGFSHKLRILTSFFFPVLLSIATESCQPLVGRAFEVSDMVANGMGVTVGLAAGAFAMVVLERAPEA